jgi:hypothetical protein
MMMMKTTRLPRKRKSVKRKKLKRMTRMVKRKTIFWKMPAMTRNIPASSSDQVGRGGVDRRCSGWDPKRCCARWFRLHRC